MKRNICGLDRWIRGFLALALAVAVATGVLTAPWAQITAGIAILVLLGTAIVGYCPAYRLLGLTPCRRD